MGRRKARIQVGLDCSVCGRRNYTVSKNKNTMPQKLIFRKYCPGCNTHTEHQEGK